MFEVGFTELLLIFAIALVVLGPEKLPRVASQVGRWLGRARAMARQFREQLEEEVNLEEASKWRMPPVPPAPEESRPQAGAAPQSKPEAEPSGSTAEPPVAPHVEVAPAAEPVPPAEAASPPSEAAGVAASHHERGT